MTSRTSVLSYALSPAFTIRFFCYELSIGCCRLVKLRFRCLFASFVVISMNCKFLRQVFSKESLKIRLRRKSQASLDCTAKSRLKFKTFTSEVQKVMKLFLASAAHCFGKIILRAHHDPQEGFNHRKQLSFFSDLAQNICTSSVRLSTKSTDYLACFTISSQS